MTPIEPPTPPRKASWKRWIVAVACVAAIALAALFLKAPVPEKVSVWFVGSTNVNGVKRLVFEGTNGLPRRIMYFAAVYPTATDPTRTNGFPAFSVEPAGAEVHAGEAFTFPLNAPGSDTNWMVAWWTWESEQPLTRWEETRMELNEFLRTHNMPAFADRLAVHAKVHIIPASEIKE